MKKTERMFVRLAAENVLVTNPGPWWCKGIRDAANIVRAFGNSAGLFSKWWKKPMCETIAYGLGKVADAKCSKMT